MDGQTLLQGYRTQMTADKTVGNTGVATSIFSTTSIRPAILSLAANWAQIGSIIRIVAQGYLASKGSAAGTLTFDFKIGSTSLGTIAVTVPDGLSGAGLRVEAFLTVRTIGGSGTIMPTCTVIIGGTLTTGFLNPSAAVTVATNAAAAIDITATWGTSDSGNTLTITNCDVQVIDPI